MTRFSPSNRDFLPGRTCLKLCAGCVARMAAKYVPGRFAFSRPTFDAETSYQCAFCTWFRIILHTCSLVLLPPYLCSWYTTPPVPVAHPQSTAKRVLKLVYRRSTDLGEGYMLSFVLHADRELWRFQSPVLFRGRGRLLRISCGPCGDSTERIHPQQRILEQWRAPTVYGGYCRSGRLVDFA